jgi:hypothetical protein
MGGGIKMSNINQYAPASSAVLNSASETVYEIDYVTGARITTTSDHKYIYQGKFFQFAQKLVISAGATYNYVFTTPDVAVSQIHYRPALITCSVDKLDVQFYEGCSTAVGTVVTAQNRNRNSTAVSTLIVAQNVTVSSSGTLFTASYIPGSTGIGGARSGGESGVEYEWVLKPTTNYCGRLINGSVADNTVNIIIHWYEETRTA